MHSTQRFPPKEQIGDRNWHYQMPMSIGRGESYVSSSIYVAYRLDLVCDKNLGREDLGWLQRMSYWPHRDIANGGERKWNEASFHI